MTTMQVCCLTLPDIVSQPPLDTRIEHDDAPLSRIVDHERVTGDQYRIPSSRLGDDEPVARVLVRLPV